MDEANRRADAISQYHNARLGLHKAEPDPLQTLKTRRPNVYVLMQEMARKQIAKGHDYSGADRDTFQNLRASEDLDIPAWKGVMVRMSDKWRRLCNFARQGTLKVADESFEDTCVDLANYALFTVIMHREGRQEAADRAIAKPKPTRREIAQKWINTGLANEQMEAFCINENMPIEELRRALEIMQEEQQRRQEAADE